MEIDQHPPTNVAPICSSDDGWSDAHGRTGLGSVSELGRVLGNISDVPLHCYVETLGDLSANYCPPYGHSR
jgi:hypothetical protein